jgi:hypothetical protein
MTKRKKEQIQQLIENQKWDELGDLMSKEIVRVYTKNLQARLAEKFKEILNGNTKYPVGILSEK